MSTDIRNSLLAVFVIVLLLAVGAILQEYIEIAQLVAVVIACGIVIILVEIRLIKIVRIGEKNEGEVKRIHKRLDDLCAELMGDNEQKMSWLCFWNVTKKLQLCIQADASFKPDMILSVGRSGAIVGSLLATNMHGLLHIGIDRINHRSTGSGASSRTVEIYPLPQMLSEVLKGKNVLCVMSECDTGRTFEALDTELRKIEKIGAIKTAVLYRSDNAYFKPNYVAEEDSGKRPTFPFRTPAYREQSKCPREQYDSDSDSALPSSRNP